MTLETLRRRHGLDEVDLMVVDTEGHDAVIVSQLRRLGYELMEEHFDTWCLDTTIEDPVTRAWRRLRPRMAAFYLRDPR